MSASPVALLVLVHGSTGRMGRHILDAAEADTRFQVLYPPGVTSIGRSWTPPDRWETQPQVIIDFSTCQGACRAADVAVTCGAALLVGTTGLSTETRAHLERAARTVPVIIAPNTSLGIAVLKALAVAAVRMIGPEGDINIIESHHAGKQDAPSGTALRLAEAINRTSASLADGERSTVPRVSPERIHPVRAGDTIGEHRIQIALPGERIELAHTAASRALFARGALRAALWLAGRAPGLYDIDQALGLRHPESNDPRP